jgi:hypothetical protein
LSDNLNQMEGQLELVILRSIHKTSKMFFVFILFQNLSEKFKELEVARDEEHRQLTSQSK